MSEDDRLLARLLGKQVGDADDEISERPTILYSVSGSGVPKRKNSTHLHKPEGSTPVELDIIKYLNFLLENPFSRNLCLYDHDYTITVVVEYF